ncbi:large-conductance mechanosensitive channel protein MscL [Christiangramia flava]|uniref:Large-conductance mechanosensitive channel n=1 Tax=Christiangramia flava JLT2011 TaxID=1229726 RepID=A0A1L7I8H9_9FLAO|nr:large-conductance mechanosensitive channel protein MscL [Christiangramia flava]APU69896.1 Large-conductance mechanosensitive channel [Christiangramia flava JLT2011]OSS37788.1 Large-conductance mechanosensitive channel [Christiangramia flava JLT2011]
MGLIKEFKDFAVKGNMVDMAIGIIIGAAFSTIVDSLVKQIISPPLSLLTGEINFEDKKWVLREAIGTHGSPNYLEEVSIGYGIFIQSVINFLIVGFVLFLFVRFMNRFREKAEDPKNTQVKTPKDIELLSKIADQMEEQNQMLRDR